MNIPSKSEAIAYLEEALERLKHPSTNANGGEMQAGGAYWRIANALRYVDDVLADHEGEKHAHFIRQTHGELVWLRRAG